MPRDIVIHLTVETPISTEVLLSRGHLYQVVANSSLSSATKRASKLERVREIGFCSCIIYNLRELRYLQEWPGCEREKEQALDIDEVYLFPIDRRL